jgi:hypothetical protein
MAKTKFSALMFDKLKDALKKTEGGNGGAFNNIMKFPAGNTYTIRLIPNVENIDETFFHHYVHQWISRSNGKFTSALSLQTFGENDPIANLRWKLYSAWKDANPNPGVDANGKKITFKSPIDQKENWFVNAYWVDNPANPELNGTVQILRMGTQLKDIVDDAMTGDGSEEFGMSIFDLSSEGCDFKIKAEQQGEYTTFKSSRFSTKSKLDLDDDEIEKIYESVHNLKEIYPIKTVDELNTLLEEHFFAGSDQKSEPEVRKQLPKADRFPPDDDDDDIPMEFPEKETKTESKRESKAKSSKVEDDVDNLIAELDL